ncbi:hypothetical protein BJX68DRAFT_257630 [Aspergillus pseudodeflectus]|uniref:S-adenosylmethionine-dependent methyltransferase-like protein n=1 Tax=Aspergillus pseudodeflectus TaxID=176178 RepID=A0ABR4JUS2_9EURO
MPLFRKKEKAKQSLSSAAFRSVEHLPSSLSAPHPDDDSIDNNSRYHVSTSQQFPPPNQPQSQFHALSDDPHQPPPRNPTHTSLQRSHTQRLRTPPDASTLSNSTSTITVVNSSPPPSHLAPPQSFDADVSDQSWPSSPTDKPDDQEPRRSKRSLFSFHSSHSSSSVREHGGLLERNRSVKKASVTGKRQSHQQKQQQQQLQHQQSPHQQQSRSSVDIWSREYAVDGPEAEHRSSMPQQNASRVPPDPGLVPHSRSAHPSPIPRSNTDPHLFDNIYRQAPVDTSRRAADLGPTSHQLDPRPPSRQSIGPPSPLPPPKSETSSVSQLGAMSDRPSGGTPQNPSQPPPSAHSSLQAAPEPGRSTPTSKDNRSRDDLGEIDIQALLQKHDELQAKYSKVKRYYFERDAQVQQLQNTVAHQRMAVSRTVLDDNEYANRFGRLDGAIKDLAFSLRKDWKIIPDWLAGSVNEDAPSTGAREMTVVGRAIISRWLVDELFERFFHPSLEPTFSRQLKAIEMTLRHQQTNTSTEEDKENAIARISNWRRTTLDGLGDSLQGPAADIHRAQITDNLVEFLVATLLSHLNDPPPAGFENGARMIIEIALGIAEKIPLESRDICVSYLAPGTPINEATMRVEPSTLLPPLTNAAAAASSSNLSHPPQTADSNRRSAEDQHHQNSHSIPDSTGPGGNDLDRDQSQPQNVSADAPDHRKRSVLSGLRGRLSGQSSASSSVPPVSAPVPAPVPAGIANSAGEAARRGSVGGQSQGAGVGSGVPRVRFAAFVTAEVRGRGPLNVLVKAPVFAME